MSAPIRVLHYIKHLNTGGGERLFFNIYQHIDRNIVQFDFAVNTKDEELLNASIREMGGKIYPVVDEEPTNILTKIKKTSKGLKALLEKQHYDIVHIHCSNGQGLYYSNIARNCGVKNVICHIHNTSVVGHFTGIKVAVHNYFRTKYLNSPTLYFACSLDAAKWLYNDAVISGDKFHLLKNGIDVNKFKYSEIDRSYIRNKLSFQDKTVICTIGRCVIEKNHIFTIKTFEELMRKNSDYRLILIGQGELEEDLKKYVTDHNLDSFVVFIKSTDEVEKYLSASDFFILSSSASEGLGIVAIESQASGLKTIISDNVPDDVLISPYVKKIPLCSGISFWANTILDWTSVDIDREVAGNYVKQAGYEIQLVANDLQKFYVDINNKKECND